MKLSDIRAEPFTGPAGPQGPRGPQGIIGNQGPQGIQGIEGPPILISAVSSAGDLNDMLIKFNTLLQDMKNKGYMQ